MHKWNHSQQGSVYLSILLLAFQLFKHGLKFVLLLLGFLHAGLALLLIGHSYYSQDKVDQVEGAEEYHQDEKDHVGLPSCSQSLKGKSNTFILY